MPEVKKRIPDMPNVLIKGVPTELEKLAYDGMLAENGNLIRQIAEDFAEPFELIPLEAHRSSRDIFSVTSGIDEKKDRYVLDLYQSGAHSFNAAFEQVARESVCQLIFNGIAHLEIVLCLTEEGEVKHIQFLPLYAQLKKEKNGEMEFISTTWDDKPLCFSVDSKFLVRFLLNDIGLKKDTFVSSFEKIKNMPQITGQMESVLHPKPWYNFNKIVRERDLAILEATKYYYYVGSAVSRSSLMSDFHIIYRMCRYKMLKRKIFDYLVGQINMKMILLEEKYHFPGQIIINYPTINYMDYYEKLKNGKITIKQMFDVFQYGQIQNEST